MPESQPTILLHVALALRSARAGTSLGNSRGSRLSSRRSLRLRSERTRDYRTVLGCLTLRPAARQRLATSERTLIRHFSVTRPPPQLEADAATAQRRSRAPQHPRWIRLSRTP